MWPARRNDVPSKDKLKTVLSTVDYLLSAGASLAILSHCEAKMRHHDLAVAWAE